MTGLLTTMNFYKFQLFCNGFSSSKKWATQLENNSCVPREQWIHRLQAQLNARLMLCNVRMLLDLGIAAIVEPVCFDLDEFDNI